MTRLVGPALLLALAPAAPGEPPAYMTNGVVPERVPPNTTTLNGKAVPAAEALRAIAAIPDDADRLRLTVIGTAAQRRAVCAPMCRQRPRTSRPWPRRAYSSTPRSRNTKPRRTTCGLASLNRRKRQYRTR